MRIEWGHSLQQEQVDAGAENLISQLFFENKRFYIFQERLRFVELMFPLGGDYAGYQQRKPGLKMAATLQA